MPPLAALEFILLVWLAHVHPCRASLLPNTNDTENSTTTTSMVTTTTVTATTTISMTTATTSSATTTVTTTGQVFLSAQPPLVGTCNSATFVSRPFWDQGGPVASVEAWNFSWGVGRATPASVHPQVEGFLREASSSRRQTLVFGPAELQALYTAARTGGLEEGAALQLELRLTMTHASGETLSSLAAVQLRDTEPPPDIRVVGSGTDLNIRQDEHVMLRVATSEVVPSCTGTARRVAIHWEHSQPGVHQWARLGEAGSSSPPDLAREADSLHFAPLAFAPRSHHLFRAIASYAGVSSSWPPSSVLFNVSVGVRGPPLARIKGPRRPHSQCGFTLDASDSSDPFAPSGTSLHFRWSCRPRDLQDPGAAHLTAACAALANFQPENVSRSDGHGAHGMTFHVAAEQLMAGAYVFHVDVRRRQSDGNSGDGQEPAASAQLEVRVAAGGRPPATLEVSWAANGKLSLEPNLSSVLASAHVAGSDSFGCQVVDTWVWTWALKEEGGQGLLPALLDTQLNYSEVGTPTELATVAFPHEVLVAGRTYSYVLLWSPRWVEIGELRSRQRSQTVTLADVVELRMLAAGTSEPFLADAPPRAGTVSTTPTEGEPAKTKFLLETTGWVDESNETLEYAFYCLPQQQNSSDLPHVEWEDTTSPNYWVRLGGRLLRSWSPRASEREVLFPPGECLLVTRARDELGATGTAFTEGPTLTEPTSFSAVQAVNMLNAAIASSSLDRLLVTVDAVSAAAAPSAGSQSAAERAGLVSMLVQALEAAVTMLGGGKAAGIEVQSVAQVLERAVTAGSLGQGSADLLRVCAVVNNCVSALAWGADPGVPRAAGEAVLSNVAVLAQGISTDVSSPSQGGDSQSTPEETLARGLLQVVSELGRAGLLGLAAGEDLQLHVKQLTHSMAQLHFHANASSSMGYESALLGMEIHATALAQQAGGQRRLSSNCDSLGLQRTQWMGVNPWRWAPRGVGHNDLVGTNTSVTTLQFWRCSEAATLEVTQTAPLRVTMSLPPGQGLPGQADCLRFDESVKAWTAVGLRVEEPPSGDPTHVVCVVTQATITASGVSLVVLPDGLPQPSGPASGTPATSLDIPLLVGAIAGGLGLLVLCFLGVHCWMRRRRRIAASLVSDKLAQEQFEDDDESFDMPPVERREKKNASIAGVRRSQALEKARVAAAGTHFHNTDAFLRQAGNPELPRKALPSLDWVPPPVFVRPKQDITSDYAKQVLALTEAWTTPPNR